MSIQCDRGYLNQPIKIEFLSTCRRKVKNVELIYIQSTFLKFRHTYWNRWELDSMF